MFFPMVKNLLRVGSVIMVAFSCSEKVENDWQYSADLDHDGLPDTVKVMDLNGNGRPDKIGDLHLTGHEDSFKAWLWTETEFDLDGEPDELRIYIDRNKDGRIDTTEGWYWRCLDLDDDGICDDEDSDLHEVDLTGKGFPHQRIRYRDTDGDGDADLRCDYPTYRLDDFGRKTSLYITGNRCMRETWTGPIYGFSRWLYLDDDDDNNLMGDADGAGTSQHALRHPSAVLAAGVEGRRTTGEAHRWYDFDGDGFTDMHMRDQGPGIMRWCFDWDGDAPRKYSLDGPTKPGESHTDYDLAFHTVGELPRGWVTIDQLKLWDFYPAFDIPDYFRERGTALDFGVDFVPANSCVYYTLNAPWRVISLNWLEDQEDAAGTKDVGCHRGEGIWSYYYDFGPKDAFIGSRRDFDRDGNSGFRLYLSPIDSLYHLYEAEDGIFYRDPDCRRNHFMLRPTPENIQRYVREIVSYSDSDNDGFFDTFFYDRDLDGIYEKVVSRPEADHAEITDMTKIWRLGEKLDSLYYPEPEDTLPVDFQVKVDWENIGYNLLAKIRLSSSRQLVGYQLWLRAEENVDYNILSRCRLQDGKNSWAFTDTIPIAQFILPGPTKVTAKLVNNLGRIVVSMPVAEVDVEPINSPAMNVGYYRAWKGNPTRYHETLFRMSQEEEVRIGECIKLEVGVEFMTTREMTLTFEPFLTDESEVPRWPIGKQMYRMGTGELLMTTLVSLVPFGEKVSQAVGSSADETTPVSLENYLGIRSQGDRVYIPPERTYRLGFRLYIDGRPIEDRILYYDWRNDIPQTIRVKG